MKRILVVFIALIFVNSCALFKGNSKNKGEIIVSYSKTACRGNCPVFKMNIYKNGYVEYEGIKNTDKIGKYSKKLTEDVRDELFMYFEVINFFSLENEYTARVTDLPSTYISYTKKDSTKTIRDYFNAPKEIDDLEIMLDKIADSNDWTKIE